MTKFVSVANAKLKINFKIRRHVNIGLNIFHISGNEFNE